MTLIELMVSVTLMTFIVLGLYQVFDATQKAMRNGANQVDATETGRSTMGILLRDLEQAASSGSTNINLDLFDPGYLNNVVTLLPSGVEATNIDQEMFFLKKGQHWTGVGYLCLPTKNPLVDDDLSLAGIRSLYRFETETNILELMDDNLLNKFTDVNGRLGRLNKVAEGVVNFSIKVLTNGVLMTNMLGEAQTTLQLSNQAPSHLDLELSLIDPEVMDEIRNIPNSTAISNYLYRLPASFQVYNSRVRVPAGAINFQ
ncbi:hypothetical protein N9B94_00835 [Verrucomicrobia bacterium]|nr:hypothetical protein [Verrucomicrobiota bacterium]